MFGLPAHGKSPKFELKALVPQLDELPKPKTLEAKIEQNQTLRVPTNIFGFLERKDKGETFKIVYVDPTSVAYRHGLQAGDRIIAGQLTKESATMVIERKNKKYVCKFALAQKQPENKKPDVAPQLSANVLSGYQMVLMVDCSASMRTADCPGDISRWEWCRKNIGKLYENSVHGASGQMPIITFDSQYRSHRGDAKKLDEIFQNSLPDGETFMAPALKEAFRQIKDGLTRDTPTIVAIISDGRPSDFEQVKAAIIEQANSLKKPDLLCISFVEIGNSERYLKELDAGLVEQGALADIVTVTPFDVVSNRGLVGALTDVALQAQKARLDKELAAKQPKVTTTGAPSASKEPVKPAAPVEPTRYPVNRIQPVKAHPSGTPADGQIAPKKVEEINEKETIRKENANRNYR
ncbi:MAG: hypothetical protein SGJ27_30950 [Candidatus Melainabacteria bacterium]|nr:hypothetical protein [Candidatus Melainabacteria bacterium]